MKYAGDVSVNQAKSSITLDNFPVIHNHVKTTIHRLVTKIVYIWMGFHMCVTKFFQVKKAPQNHLALLG